MATHLDRYALPPLTSFSSTAAFPSFALHRAVQLENRWDWEIEVYVNCYPLSPLTSFPCCTWGQHYWLPHSTEPLSFQLIVFPHRVKPIPQEVMSNFDMRRAVD
jgi:hypothetical protein